MAGFGIVASRNCPWSLRGLGGGGRFAHVYFFTVEPSPQERPAESATATGAATAKLESMLTVSSLPCSEENRRLDRPAEGVHNVAQ